MTTSPTGDTGKSLELATRLEEEILRAGLRPGWRLPSEEQLCTTYAVSRTVVREAIQQLKSRGLATSRRGGGTYVAAASATDVGRALRIYAGLADSAKAAADLRDFRATIAAAAARAMAARRDRDAVARLKTALDALRRARDHDGEFAEAALLFRHILAQESDNRLYAAILGSLDALATTATTRGSDHAAARERAIAEHEALFEAIRTANLEAAAALASALVPKPDPAPAA